MILYGNFHFNSYDVNLFTYNIFVIYIFSVLNMFGAKKKVAFMMYMSKSWF